MRDYEDLKRRIDQLRRDDPEFTVYNSRAHKYRIAPVIKEAELLKFELQNRIELPKEYRDYILLVGNGGAGPCIECGLLPLNANKDHGGLLALPFPFSESWCPLCSSLTVDDILQQTNANSPKEGSLFIGGHGCSLRIHLIITGAMRGQIWIDDFGSDNGIWAEGDYCPCFFCDETEFKAAATKRRYTFYDWYDNWIDESYAKLNARP
jgi:hypothetical protein